MRKGSFINGIIAILIIIISCILGVNIWDHLKPNGVYNQVASIQILERNIVTQEENQVSNPSQSIEAVGETTFEKNTENTFRGIKYYYDQLGDYAKIVYQAFENNVENLKTGTYKIEFQDEFDELLKQENGSDVLNDEFQRAWDAFYYDRPDVFYLDPNKFSITIETSKRGFITSYNVYINNGNNESYLDSGFSDKQEIDQYIKQMEILKEQFIDQMTVMSSDYERIKALHDWIVDNIEYDSSMQQVHRTNICGALIDRTVVCEGYAKLFKYILDDMGIDCVLVSGTAVNSKGIKERHMWNYVNLDGKWYAVDCTWDDPIIIGGGKVDKDIKYKYFLKGPSFFKDHTEEPITEKSESLEYPKISEQDYQK